MVLYCMNCKLVLVVIKKMFLHICLQKSGLGDNARSRSHLAFESVIVKLDEKVSL